MGPPAVRVRLPRSLTDYWAGARVLDATGASLADVLRDLDQRFPGLTARVLDDQGRFRRYVTVFVNEERVGAPRPEAVALAEGDLVHILPSVAGGCFS